MSVSAINDHFGKVDYKGIPRRAFDLSLMVGDGVIFSSLYLQSAYDSPEIAGLLQHVLPLKTYTRALRQMSEKIT